MDLTLTPARRAIVRRASNLATVASQALNVALLDGEPDETISGRAFRQGVLGGDPRWRRTAAVINAAFFWQADHCRGSHLRDVKFACSIAKATAAAHGLDFAPAAAIFDAALARAYRT